MPAPEQGKLPGVHCLYVRALGFVAQRTGLSTRKGLLDDPVAETVPQLPDIPRSEPVMRTMPRTPIYVEMQEPFVEMIDRIALEGMDPQKHWISQGRTGRTAAHHQN